MPVSPLTPSNPPTEASWPARESETSIATSIVGKVVEFFVSVSAALGVLKISVPSPARLRRLVQDSALYVRSFFSISVKVVVSFFTFGQPYLYSSMVERLSITGLYEVEAAELLSQLILDANSKIKMSAVLLSLAFTLMQTISGETWPIQGAMLYASIMSSFMSIALHFVAASCYDTILQNGAGAGATRWLSHARTTTETPLMLDPWIALSIPSAWTFWSFGLFFVVTVMQMTAWDLSLSPSLSPSANLSSGAFCPGNTIAVLSVLALGLTCNLVVGITWRRYMHHHLRHVQVPANIEQS